MAWSRLMSDVASRTVTVFEAPGVDLGVAGDVRAAATGEVAAGGDRRVEGAVDEHPGGAVLTRPHVGVPAERAARGVDGQCAVVVDVVEDDVGVGVGVGEPHRRGVVGRRDLGLEPVVERHAVVVRLSHLVLVAERQRSRAPAGVRGGGRGRRHQLERVAVAHPGAGLVAGRERLDPGPVVGVVVAVVLVQPRRRAGVRHRGPEVEPVGHGGGREVVAAREVAVGLRSPGGDDVVAGPSDDDRLRLTDDEVVDPPAEVGRTGRVVVAHENPVDGLAGGDTTDERRARVPLVGVERLGRALGARAHPEPQLVDGAQVGQVGAVGEGEVDRRIRARVAQVALGQLREDPVGELGLRADRDVDVVDLVPGLAAGRAGDQARIPEGLEAREAHAGLGVVGAGRPAADLGDHRPARRDGGAAVGEPELGQLDDPAALVRGDVEPVCGVGGGVRDVEHLGLEPLVEALPRLAVDRGPGGPVVVGALDLPVAGVAFRRVVGAGQGVALHGDTGGEAHPEPAGRGEGQPLAVLVAVDRLGRGLVGRVLRAGGHAGVGRGDVARDAHLGRPGDPRALRPLGSAHPGGGRLAGLERAREGDVAGRSRGGGQLPDRRCGDGEGGDGEQRGGTPVGTEKRHCLAPGSG